MCRTQEIQSRTCAALLLIYVEYTASLWHQINTVYSNTKHFRTLSVASEKNATLNFSEQMHSE